MPLPVWMQAAGQQAATNAAGAIIGMGLGSLQDRRQIRQGDRLLNQQIRANKEMGDYNFQKQLEMWHATNFKAQVKEAEEAGLNPGLLYGMGGAGGTTVGQQGANVNAPEAPKGGGEIMGAMGMGMNLQLLEAQKEVMASQADLNRAHADKTRGIDTREGEARISEIDERMNKLFQETENLRQDHTIKKLQITMQNIENFEKQASQENRLNYIMQQAKTAALQVRIMENETNIREATTQDAINKIKEDAIGAALRNELTKAQSTLTAEETRKVSAQIAQEWTRISQGWDNLDRQERELKLKEFEANVKAQWPGVMQLVGGTLLQLTGKAEQAITGKNPTPSAPDTNKK